MSQPGHVLMVMKEALKGKPNAQAHFKLLLGHSKSQSKPKFRVREVYFTFNGSNYKVTPKSLDKERVGKT